MDNKYSICCTSWHDLSSRINLDMYIFLPSEEDMIMEMMVVVTSGQWWFLENFNVGFEAEIEVWNM